MSVTFLHIFYFKSGIEENVYLSCNPGRCLRHSITLLDGTLDSLVNHIDQSGAAAECIIRKELRSNLSITGCLARSSTTGGTTYAIVTLKFWIEDRNCSRSKRCMICIGTPRRSGMNIKAAIPVNVTRSAPVSQTPTNRSLFRIHSTYRRYETSVRMKSSNLPSNSGFPGPPPQLAAYSPQNSYA